MDRLAHPLHAMREGTGAAPAARPSGTAPRRQPGPAPAHAPGEHSEPHEEAVDRRLTGSDPVVNAPADDAWTGFSTRRNLMYAFTLPEAPPARRGKASNAGTRDTRSSPETDGA